MFGVAKIGKDGLFSLKLVEHDHILVCVCVCRASMSPDLFQSAAYIYMNSFILACGMWAIIATDSVDAVLMVSNKSLEI